MNPNPYLPPTLPLMSDAALAQLKREYETVHAELKRADAPAAPDDPMLLRQAIDAIAGELNARGFDAEPWWTTRRLSAQRPPRRMVYAPPLRPTPNERCP